MACASASLVTAVSAAVFPLRLGSSSPGIDQVAVALVGVAAALMAVALVSTATAYLAPVIG